jgi:hypothetical protein
MTEQGWLWATDPGAMLDFLVRSGKASDRKLRLLTCACTRVYWDLLVADQVVNSDEGTFPALLTAEQYADGLVNAEALEVVARDAAQKAAEEEEFLDRLPSTGAGRSHLLLLWLVAAAAEASADLGASKVRGSIGMFPRTADRAVAMVRDIFSNPFKPSTAIDASWVAWNSGSLKNLAQVAYDELQLPAGYLEAERLAVLADALEQAGCADANLMSHLRAEGPHVRGCWALDLVLNRK